MAGKWDYNLISRIQQANDIVDVISEHLNLEKKGKEMVGLCPFHADHKPSMSVSPVKQIFKCFACGAGGDVLKFVQMKENLTFPQTVERLAQRAGIEIEPVRRQGGNAQTGQLDSAKLEKMNAWALKIWVENLWHPEAGDAVRKYITDRGISEELARKWKLGFALDAWDDLTGKIAHRKDAAQSLIQAGLAVQRENGGCYDKFRNRLMFPIVDVTGRVIGFGGRTLGDDPAKYMNSPATVLFDKSHSLYGLDRSREAISKSGTVVVVEGYTDVMMAHQFGIENVVAALGTSLTTGHARILRRYAKRIVLVFDSDVAGKAAADRALEVCLDQKIDVQLAFVPEGKDPCEYLLEAGPEAFRNVIDAAEDVLEFKWKVLEEQLGASQNLSDRTEAIRGFLQTAAPAMQARQMDPVSRTVTLGRLSELLGISVSRIEEHIAAIQKHKRAAQQPDDTDERLTQTPEKNGDLVLKAQHEILEVLLERGDCFQKVAGRVAVDDFGPDECTKELAEAIFDILSQNVPLQLSQVYSRLESSQTAALLTQLQTASEQKTGLLDQLDGALTELEKRRQDGQIQTLKQRMGEDDGLKQMLSQIAQKGPNLRNAGIRS
ncbi:MAG: DNA primase [Anaerohalosphaeraceae bacterium]